MISRPSHSRGFAVLAAIFLMVVLAALGAYMVGISSAQNRTSALDIQGARAYQAARAGIEWGLWVVEAPENATFANGGSVPATCAVTHTCQYVCPGVDTVLPTLGGTLADFTVSVGCTSNDYSEAGVTKRVYTLTSTATWGADPTSPDYVDRQIVTTVSTCRQVTDGGLC